jgi:hypothetical protein
MIEVFAFDTDRYRIREWVQATLGVDRLEALHEDPCDGATRHTLRMHRYTTRLKTAFTGPVLALFAEFVREYALPRVPFVPWTHVLPNFRVHEHGREATSPMHRDRDYVRERGLLKIWLPFTRVSGGGTLWVESAEGRGDMAPVTLEYGQALLFDSLNLMHGCRFNDSGGTRVSMDFMIRPDPVLNHLGKAWKS